MVGILKQTVSLLSQQQSVINQLSSRTLATVAKKYVFSNQFVGEPKATDLTLVEEPLPALKDGDILVEAEYLSLDPYMRAYAPWLKTGCTMIGAQVGKILDSKHPKYPAGRKIHGYFGWRSHTVVNPDEPPSKEQMMKDKPYLLPDFGDLPSSLAVGMLGMPGNTAYFGFLDICKPREGETAVVSTAAGAVGMHVGQLAKIHGLKVIGITGSDAKCKWVVDELGFDHAINYKTQNVSVALKEAAPKGYDCYFDNVGGEISTSVIYQMKLGGRIAVCGSTSSYNSPSLPKTSILQPAMVFKQLRMEGFVVTRYGDRWFEGIEKNLGWIKEGKLKYRETVTHGFENMYNAFVSMLRGENTGKAVVKA